MPGASPLFTALAGTVMLSLAAAAATAQVAPQLPNAAVCAAAAQTATNLPPNLLLSIGMVESGRADPLTGRVTPWPWTVNVDGAGRFFTTEADAAAFVRLAQSSGAGDIDIGCFQVSLRYHPDAFASIDQGFAPAANAGFAAAYLTQLRAQTGSWAAAVADYHSAAPDLGLPYRRRVLAAWASLGTLPPDLAFASNTFTAPDLVVIREAPAARLVRVFTLADPADAGLPPGAPRVITP